MESCYSLCLLVKFATNSSSHKFGIAVCVCEEFELS